VNITRPRSERPGCRLRQLPVPVAVAVLSALGAWAAPARACPCSDDAGAGVSLLRSNERYGVEAMATARSALGRFDALGHYRALPTAEAEYSEELLLRAGLRFPKKLEWLAELGYASYRFRAPGIHLERAGLGDATLRGRYALRDEGMPHDVPRWPSLHVSGSIRAPLGSLGPNPSSGFGSGGVELGLGAWELGVGFVAARSTLPMLNVSLAGEIGYRLPDEALGRERQLGPRLELMMAAKLEPLPAWSTSLGLRARFNGPASLDGESVPGTGERLVSVVGGAGFYDQPTGFRASVMLSFDPPISKLSYGSTAGTALGVRLGVAR
jgi:hypothetical protein